jgi:hypothetical protein
MHIRRINSGLTCFALTMASYVAPWRGKYGLWTLRKVREEDRSPVSAPAQLSPWRWASARSGSPARGAGGYASVCTTSPVHAQDARSVHLWRCCGVGARGSQGVDGSSRMPYRSGACTSRHSPTSGRRASGAAVETAAGCGSRSGAVQPIRVKMALQPAQADAVIYELGDREVNHAPVAPHTLHGGYT